MARKTPPPLRLVGGEAVKLKVTKFTEVTEDRPRQRCVLSGTVGLVERAELGGTVLLIAVAVAPDGLVDAVVAGSSEVTLVAKGEESA